MTGVDTYLHTQGVASTLWVITHNLEMKAPAVDVWVDVNSEIVKIIPSRVVIVDINTCHVHFTTARAGTAVVA